MNNNQNKLEKLTRILNRKVRNKRITKGLLMAGYDDSSLKLKRDKNGNIIGSVDDTILTQFENERKSGNFYLNHLILRDSTRKSTFGIDNAKPLYLIDGIPLIVYILTNLTQSGLEKIAVVGSREIGLVTEAFVELYHPKQEILFSDEGANWSLDNTLLKGKEKLNPADELVFISTGDVPFLYDINKIIRNRKYKKYEAVLNLNTKEKVGKYFPRNFHLKVGRYEIKEPNCSEADLNKIPYDLIKILYSDFRKFYADHANKKIPIKKEEIVEIAKEYWTEPAILRAIPKLASKFPGANWKLKLISFLIEKYTSLFDKGLPRISRSSFEDILCLVSNMKIKVLLTNNDPATLEDMDSHEDWCYMNEMIRKGKSSFYPHYDKVQEFKKVMPELKKNIDLIRVFEEYINKTFNKFGLFGKPYYTDGNPFLGKMPYNSQGELDIIFTKVMVDEMINNNIRFHQRYLRRHLMKEALFRKEYK